MMSDILIALFWGASNFFLILGALYTKQILDSWAEDREERRYEAAEIARIERERPRLPSTGVMDGLLAEQREERIARYRRNRSIADGSS